MTLIKVICKRQKNKQL